MPSAAPSSVQYKSLPSQSLSQTPVGALANASLFANKWYKKNSNVILIHQKKLEYSIYLSSLDGHRRPHRGSRFLYTTVDLLRDVGSRERAPVPARLSDLLRDGQLLDLVRLHEELQEEAGGRVPSDVATVVLSARGSLVRSDDGEGSNVCDVGKYSLERPDSRMVGIELNDNVSVGPHLLDVTALRVVGVHDGAVPGPCALGQDVHVEAVEVDRVAAA